MGCMEYLRWKLEYIRYRNAEEDGEFKTEHASYDIEQIIERLGMI